MWAKPMANTDYYQEHILHLAMHNPPSMLYPLIATLCICESSYGSILTISEILVRLIPAVGINVAPCRYFNPCWAVGYCMVSWEDNLLYANLFHELTEMAGCTFASRKWATAEFAGWDDEVVASGLLLPDGTTVYRVTAFDGKTAQYVKQTAEGISIQVPGSSKPPLVIKGGVSKGSGPNAPYGVWIESKGSF